VPSAAGDRGSTAIEFVLLTPVMFFMIFAAVQFAMYSFAEHVAKSAAQAGARTGRAEADQNEQWRDAAERKGNAYIDQLGPGLFLSRPDVVAHCRPSCAVVDRVRVEVQGSVPSLLPGVTLTVRASSEGPVERFKSDEG
jgi:Flp pilus assembly protein TadG